MHTSFWDKYALWRGRKFLPSLKTIQNLFAERIEVALELSQKNLDPLHPNDLHERLIRFQTLSKERANYLITIKTWETVQEEAWKNLKTGEKVFAFVISLFHSLIFPSLNAKKVIKSFPLLPFHQLQAEPARPLNIPAYQECLNAEAFIQQQANLLGTSLIHLFFEIINFDRARQDLEKMGGDLGADDALEDDLAVDRINYAAYKIKDGC